VIVHGYGLVPGLSLHPDVIDADRELALAAWVGELAPAPASGRHRIDLYGRGAFNEGYSGGRRVSDQIPTILDELARDLIGARMLEMAPDQVTVSEYLPGQGVGPHADRIEGGPVITGVALLADATMRLVCGTDPPLDLRYPRRAALRMEGPCRFYPWLHQILPVTLRRISIVFRRAAG
jgi:hypothetical protein